MTCSFFETGKMTSSKRISQLSGKSFDEKYKILQKIGEGAHGVVKKCISRKTGK